ncbi:MAG TPA: serine hydrolase [Dokdonella sp.]|uniref:serine hydrolase domain-containing protein n=1 Tax=Dokdonella sp. TaxID=2291710 RepID=UPI002D800C2E|nr:serine hydrolase [Dokdonella sp.]HET9033094.1 serine hydrolase [Dokdonella sp.]
MRCPACLLSASLLACSLAEAKSAHPDSLDDGWKVGDAKALGWSTARFDEAERKIADGTWKGTTSLVVAHHGKLVYEGYFNGGSRDQLNDTRSLTKTITAMLVGAAIDRKLIPDGKAQVWPYFKDRPRPLHPDKRKQTISLEDLLTMSSLLECNDENQFSSGNEERMYVSEDWIGFVLDLPIKGFPPWESKPADSPYGRAFSYCTAGSFLLGAVVEKATHQRLDKFSAEVLETPLGINKVKWNFAPDGTAMGGGGTRFRSRDLAKLGELLRNEGQWNGKSVLARDWVRSMLSVHAQARDDADYGYQIWRFSFPHKGKQQPAWAMSGNGGNYVFIVPELELVSVITSKAYNQRFAHPQSQKIFSDIVLKALP